MKLGIIANPEIASLDYAKNLGLEFIEFDVNCATGSPWDDPSSPRSSGHALLKMADEFKAGIARTGVEVGAVGRWGSKILDADGKMIDSEFDHVKALIEFVKQVGAGAYLVSVNYVDGLSYYKNITAAIDYLNKVCEYAGDLPVCIVNCNTGTNYIRTPDEWRLVLTEVPKLKIKYDPSHSFIHGGPTGAYMEEAFEFGDRFGYVHIKGVIQSAKYDHSSMGKYFKWMREIPELGKLVRAEMEQNGRYYDNPPAGLDSINWRAFMAILYKHGYDGMLSLEPHSRVWQGDLGERGVKFSIDYMRSLMI